MGRWKDAELRGIVGQMNGCMDKWIGKWLSGWTERDEGMGGQQAMWVDGWVMECMRVCSQRQTDKGIQKKRLRWDKGYSLSPIFTALHCDSRSPQFVREEVYHMVVPEELNLLDFSNVDVHINVTHMICLWFEGSSANIDIKCSFCWVEEYLG